MKVGIYAREKTEGWDVWGNETEKFSSSNTVKEKLE